MPKPVWTPLPTNVKAPPIDTWVYCYVKLSRDGEVVPRRIIGSIWTTFPDSPPDLNVWHAGFGDIALPGIHTSSEAMRLVEGLHRQRLRDRLN